MNLKENVIRFRMVVIALNCLLATLSLVNLYTIATGAIQVEIPEETDFAWTIDTKYDEANFLANFTVTNQGIYDIEDLDIHAVLRTEKGTMLIDYCQNDLSIPSGHVKIFNINAVMPFERIEYDEWRSLMINDSVFYLDVYIKANYLWGLGTFIVDDTLEYAWEAPLTKIGNETNNQIAGLLKYLLLEKGDVDGFMDKVMEDVWDNEWLGKFDWVDATLRLESWPQGDNTSKMIIRVTLDVMDGMRTVTFELELMFKMEDGEYDVTMEDFRFDIQ